MNYSKDEHSNWSGLYKVSAVCALLVVIVAVLDIVLAMLAGEAKENSAVSVVEWFTLFQLKPISAFSNLGLLNIIYNTLAIPLYLSLYHIHRKFDRAYTLLAAVMFFMGVTIYFSTNTVFSMYALSRQYASAVTDIQKSALIAAGQSALALGADLTPSTFLGFFFTEVAGIIMAVVMLRAGIFSKMTAWVGILALGCMVLFNIAAAFIPAVFNFSITLGMFGGLLSMAYYILLARKLFQLANEAHV